MSFFSKFFKWKRNQNQEPSEQPDKTLEISSLAQSALPLLDDRPSNDKERSTPSEVSLQSPELTPGPAASEWASRQEQPIGSFLPAQSDSSSSLDNEQVVEEPSNQASATPLSSPGQAQLSSNRILAIGLIGKGFVPSKAVVDHLIALHRGEKFHPEAQIRTRQGQWANKEEMISFAMAFFQFGLFLMPHVSASLGLDDIGEQIELHEKQTSEGPCCIVTVWEGTPQRVQAVRSTSTSAPYPGENVKIGDFIGDDFEVRDIKQGGLGRVYLCYDHNWREPVAIKAFQWEGKKRSLDDILADFKSEADKWIRLDRHPNIVEAKRVFIAGGLPLLLLELIPGVEGMGPSLRERLKGRPLPIPKALNFAVQFCLGMDYAHSKLSIIHRDIKPENTLITPDGALKITDFGLAATLAEVSDRSKAAGTLPYMSPEQLAGQSLDIRSDIYGSGVMLYEMLTGYWPFIGTQEQMIEGHLRGRPPDPRQLRRDLDNSLADLILCCLEKHPNNRPANFAELSAALNDLLVAHTGDRLSTTFSPATLDADDWHNKGVSLADLGHYEEALAALDHALELRPKSVETWNSKGVTLKDAGRLAEALIALDYALVLNPKHINAWNNKGATLKVMGRFEEAITCCDQALAIDPTYDHAWIDKGAILHDQGKQEEAIACFERALSLNPSAQAWSNKGISLRRLGRFEEALKCQDEALRFEPRNARTWVAKGAVFLDMGRYEEALNCFERALQINLAYSLAWMDKGTALMQLDRFDEGITCFETALRFDPNNVLAREQLDGYRQAQSLEGWLKQGLDLFDAKEYQSAISQFDRVLAAMPNYAGAWFHKGVALGHLGQLPEAIACLDRAIELDPQNDDAWRNKAFALQSLNLVDQALACYEEAIKQNPRSDAAWLGKGTILGQMQKLEEALVCFKRACEINPDNTQAENNRQLAELMLGFLRR